MNIMPDEALDAALSIGEYSSRSDAACKEALACKEVLVRILQGLCAGISELHRGRDCRLH